VFAAKTSEVILADFHFSIFASFEIFCEGFLITLCQ
jgi:hypothetical protein